VQVRPQNLDAQGATDAGGQHFGPRLDGHPPDVGHSRELHLGVELGQQVIPALAPRPFLRRLERDNSLKHRERSWVRWALEAACLAEHPVYFGEGFEDPVHPLKHVLRGGVAHTWHRDGHVQQRPLVQGRHELAAQ
jgi:hypothetical protein